MINPDFGDPHDLLRSCPIGRALLSQIELARATGCFDRFELVTLWHVAGRPRYKSPRRWLVGRDIERHDPGGGPDAPIYVDIGNAFEYIVTAGLDPTSAVLKAHWMIISKGFRATAAQTLIKPNYEIPAIFAKGSVLDEGMSPTEADRVLLDEVLDLCAEQGLDEFATETAVMHAQRNLHLTNKAMVRRADLEGDGGPTH